MDSETLLDLATEIREHNTRLSELTRRRVPEAEQLVTREQTLLKSLVTQLELREMHVERLTETLADRLNNLLMSIQTVSDLLRNPPDEAVVARLRRQLNDTVGAGKESLEKLRAAVGQLR